ncbi:MAG: lysylphosphatidylglycerol synthase transmembrane domain-containing protein [Candidatus Aenigmatarchaeota archaeon]
MRNRMLNIALSLAAVALLAVLIVNSNPSAIVKTLSNANPVFVAGALFVTVSIIAIKIVRWRLLLDAIGIKVTAAEITKPYMASLFISNITPGRVGEPVRSYYFKRSLGYPISKTLPTILLERILDMSALAAFYIFGLFTLVAFLNKLLAIGIGLVVLGLILVFVAASNKRLLTFLFDRFYSLFKFIPAIKKLRKKLEKLPGNFHAGFILASKSRQMPLIIIITLIAWVMEFLIIKLSFLAINVNVPFTVIASIASVATIIGLLTFLPGNIGSFEASAAFFLTQAVPNMTLATATSGILLYRISSLLFALLISSPSFIGYHTTESKAFRA